MKRIISLILSFVLVFTMMPSMKVSAATQKASASFGNGLTWTLYDDGELVISSNGATVAMPDYNSGNAPWYSYVDEIKQVTFGEGITHIGNRTFQWYNKLEYVTLPTTLVSIGDYAFMGTAIDNIQLWDGLESIGKYAFAQCKQLTEIDIPNTVKTIGDSAFSQCTALKTAKLPRTLSVIPRELFYSCSSLTTVTMPIVSTTTIDYMAFYGCKVLSDISIPDSVTTIGEKAFYGCDAFTTVSIPENVTEIARYTFYGSDNIKTVYLPEAINNIGDYAFDLCTNLSTVNFAGSAGQWKKITKGTNNTYLTSANIIYGKYDIIAVPATNGTVNVDKAVAAIDETVTINAVPTSGYALTNILIDGTAVEGNPYVLTVSGNHEVSADFVALSGYTVSLAPEINSVTDNETAIVKVKVDAQEGITTYNAVDITLGYSGVDLVTDTVSGYTVTKGEGTVRIQGYGEDKAVGTGIDLVFTNPDPTTGGTVTVEKAYVDEAANAIGADAPEAQYGVRIATIIHGGFSVNLSDDFTGEGTVPYGEDYTFTAKDNNYTYTFTVTIGGVEKAVKDNGDGTFTVEDVTGPLVINATKTPKTFTVTVNGNAKDDVTATGTPTYGTDFTFKVDEKEYYGYTVKVTVGGVDYTYAKVDGTYTIKGTDITGDIVITAEKELTTLTVTFEGGAAGAATGESTVAMGEDYEFTVNKETGYDYTITAKMGEEDATLSESDGKYVIADVTANLVITIERELAVDVTVSEYVKLDSTKVFLVVAKGDTKDGDVLGYDGNPMYISEKYDGYAYLVIAEELTVEEATSKVAQLTATTTVIDNSGDVNCTGVIDINDAQLAYDIYNAKYTDFSLVSMEKFLRADVNDTIGLDVNDAVSVVAKIN